MAITIQLKKERETKNTVRFEEMENAEGNPPAGRNPLRPEVGAEALGRPRDAGAPP